MIGISTSWLTERPNITGRKVIEEIVTLGFRAVELDYRITDTMLKEMYPLILKERLKILSIHNFLPLPEGVPASRASGDLFLLSSPDREERDQAVKGTIRTIQIAQNLGAPVVVLHLGRVDMDPEWDQFKALFHRRMLDSPEGKSFAKRKLRQRKRRKEPYLESVFHSLDRLNREAEKRGLLLGIENRYHYHEIPDFEEIGRILGRFPGESICYWHDVGHAHAHERLGLLEPGALLRAYGSKTAGVHIHDAQGIDDHWAPGTGEIDFMPMREAFRHARARILEVHKKSDRGQLLKGVDLLRKMEVV